MAILFRNYNPAKVAVSFNGIQLVGFMDGTFVSCERAEDAFETAVGAGGDVVRVRNQNRMGSVTVTLQAASPSNDDLSAIARDDEAFGLDYGDLLVKDGNGTTIARAEIAWIRKLPNVEYADSESGREWVFDCAELLMDVGGSVA
jgi:hypothetical protein